VPSWLRRPGRLPPQNSRPMKLQTLSTRELRPAARGASPRAAARPQVGAQRRLEQRLAPPRSRSRAGSECRSGVLHQRPAQHRGDGSARAQSDRRTALCDRCPRGDARHAGSAQVPACRDARSLRFAARRLAKGTKGGRFSTAEYCGVSLRPCSSHVKMGTSTHKTPQFSTACA